MTNEERLEAKKKAFQENPDEFVHKSELIVAARCTDTGRLEVIFGKYDRAHLISAYGEVTYRYFMTLDKYEAVKTANMAANKRIIRPGDK